MIPYPARTGVCPKCGCVLSSYNADAFCGPCHKRLITHDEHGRKRHTVCSYGDTARDRSYHDIYVNRGCRCVSCWLDWRQHNERAAA